MQILKENVKISFFLVFLRSLDFLFLKDHQY